MQKNTLRNKVYEQARRTLEKEIPSLEESIKKIEQRMDQLKKEKDRLSKLLDEDKDFVEEASENFGFVRHFFMGYDGSQCGWLLFLNKEFLSDTDGFSYEEVIKKRDGDREHRLRPQTLFDAGVIKP
ncbi:hypothetical protein [Bacillus sp. LJBS17]|uniref:hypothetical protein n=1 Tax=Bacillus sp. LJBS17 TaxID=2859227 RepID=UPI001C566824|nr:hypothetical protein [Bacillus sp. LJBS17]QXW81054.1 hypothetical protein KXZ66_17545 [Bacillus sp. LJBS17]